VAALAGRKGERERERERERENFCLTCFGLLAHLKRQVYNFGSGSNLLGMASAPGD
jgi:hypothetical protein